MRWRVLDTDLPQSRCWQCQQSYYCYIFYHRELANAMFNRVTHSKFINKIPNNLYSEFQQKIEKLNEYLSITKTSFQTDSEKLSLITPIIIGEFEISSYKYMESAQEFIEKLLRDEIMNSVKIKNADKKDDKFYK